MLKVFYRCELELGEGSTKSKEQMYRVISASF